jgi:L-iditol 2-dehydrogenase
MKAAFFEGPGRIEVRETPDPVCPPGGLLTRVEACAICGTDLRSFDFGSRHKGQISGHETVGTVVEVGEGVTGFKVGDRVTDCPVTCGECGFCRTGVSNLCPTRGRVGGVAQGGFAEMRPILASAVSGGFVVKVPPELPAETATLIEPLACVINGNEKLDVKPDTTVAIIGSGPIGVLHLILAKLRGAGEITMVDLKDERLDQAGPFGAGHLVNAAKTDPVARVREFTGGVGADVVVVACVSASAQAQAVEMAAKRGQVLMFAGLPESSPTATLNVNLIHYNELRLIGARSSVKRQWDLALDLLMTGKVSGPGVVNASVPLERIQEGFEMVRSGKVLKVAVKPQHHLHWAEPARGVPSEGDRQLAEAPEGAALSHPGTTSGPYSRMSPGWHASSRQMASSVENLTALALPVLRIERLASVIPTRSARSVSEILRSTMTRSSRTIIAMSSSPRP